MNQKSLGDYGYVEYMAPSRSVEHTNHVVSKIDGELYCSCKGFKFYGRCFHVSEIELAELRIQLEYVLKLEEPISRAHFKSVADVINWLECKGSPEHELFCNTALQYARGHGTVTTDDIHRILGEKICWGKKGIGSALRSLETKGYLKYLYQKKSERSSCHHRGIGVFAITTRGKNLFKGGMK